MAQKTFIELVDDLDGSVSDDISTVGFSLDGVEYEIDLTEGNAEKLRSTLEEFVVAARRTGGRLKRGTARATSADHSAAADREQAKAIRSWARAHGYELAERGRIPSNAIAAYQEAQAAPAKPKAKRPRRKPKEASAA
jgi:nucleoid-associated protein Lsr2